MPTSTYLLRAYWSLAAVAALLAGPAHAAAEPKLEISFDPVTRTVADRIPYATPFALAATLPDGADAKLSYWPRGPKRSKRSCAQARIDNQDYLIERQGVASGAAEKELRKYVFAVDPLRVNVSYCFAVEYTYTELSANLRDRVAGGIGRAFLKLLAVFTTPAPAGLSAAIGTRYGTTCSQEDLRAMADGAERLPGCALVHELGEQEPMLKDLRVRSKSKRQVEPFLTVFEQRLAEDPALRALLGETLRTQQLRTKLLSDYDNDLANARATVSAAPPADQPALATTLQALPAVPNGTCGRLIDDAWAVAQCGPRAALETCKHLTALRSNCRELTALKDPVLTLKESDLFKALIDDMKQVLHVRDPPENLPLGKPTFDEWIPFHASLDVGAAAIAFRSDIWGLAQYIGVNFYFAAVERDERLTWGHRGYKAFGRRELLKRLSLTLGITTTGGSLRKDDGVSGALGNQLLLYGAGFRLLGGLRLSAGGVIYKQSSQNPARAGAPSLKTSPFIGLSLDIDLFRWIRRGAGYEK